MARRDDEVRVLLLADTHLGFDEARRPGGTRPRRGADFFTNYERALAPARRGEVDVVVHGGDLLYRSRVPPSLVQRAFAPLFAVADTGVPVLVVPGNHERSHIPYPLFALHRNIHLFDRPRTVSLRVRGLAVSVTGFPFDPFARTRLSRLLTAAHWDAGAADVRLLCVHQAFEGAQVGPAGFTFREGADVIRLGDVPRGFAAVLSGHIHRHQVLDADARGRPAPVPVFYPGAIERTSFAERDEAKGWLELHLARGSRPGGVVRRWRFCELPTRPMHLVELETAERSQRGVLDWLRRTLSTLPPRSVVRLRVPSWAVELLAGTRLETLLPPEAILELRATPAAARSRLA